MCVLSPNPEQTDQQKNYQNLNLAEQVTVGKTKVSLTPGGEKEEVQKHSRAIGIHLGRPNKLGTLKSCLATPMYGVQQLVVSRPPNTKE